MDTKEKILHEALVCFAEKGYHGTNLRDLASRCGLSKSALYKHFQSKEDIRTSLIRQMEQYYEARFSQMGKVCPDSLDAFHMMSLSQIRFTMSDPNIILCRKMLAKEQYTDPYVAKLASAHFLDGTKTLYAELFRQMMEKGLMRKMDAELLGLSYTAPITSLIHLVDREPNRKEEAMEEMEKFISLFLSTYGVIEK